MNFMATGIPFNNDPRPPPSPASPVYKIQRGDVDALEYRPGPRVRGWLERWIRSRCSASVSDLSVVACAAERAGNSQHGRDLSVQFRVWARTAFVDIDTALKTRQGVVQDHRVGPVVSDQIGKIPTRRRACLEAAIVPTGIQV